MTSQIDRALRFRALHQGPEPLLMPNPWDGGSARLLEGLGFAALGTTSLGVALADGKRRSSREDILANCGAIAAAVRVPVSADLEDGHGSEPEAAASAVGEAWARGAVGASIEDASGDPRRPIYDAGLAAERIAAAVEAAKRLPGPLVLTARAENLLHGRDDLGDTIRRLQAYEEAGAEVLYAPGLRTLDQIRAVVSSVGRPVNVVMGFADPKIRLEDLREAGVRRVSIGGALCRLALAAFLEGARSMQQGRFDFVERIAPIDALQSAFPND